MVAVAACTNTKATSSEVSHNENDSSTQSVILLINYAYQKAQIISCADSMILVGVGSIGVFDLDSVPLSLDLNSDSLSLSLDNVIWDKDRGLVSRKLNKTDIRILSNISSRLKCIEYFDNSVVKDGVEFNVYLNNKKKVCCYKAHLDHIPKEISDIISQIINIASPLYEVNYGS